MLVRKITIGANHILNESDVPEEVQEQPDLFADHEALEKQKAVQAYGESLLKKADFKLLIPAQTVPAGK